RNDLSTAEVKEIEEYGKKTVIIQAQNRDQPLTSFAGRPIERYKEIRVFYQKKISALETQKSKIRTDDQRMMLLNSAKSWLKES
ncbi:hypothetical protein WAJ21_21630, partial [Acinetobacter baumannii]